MLRAVRGGLGLHVAGQPTACKSDYLYIMLDRHGLTVDSGLEIADVVNVPIKFEGLQSTKHPLVTGWRRDTKHRYTLHPGMAGSLPGRLLSLPPNLSNSFHR